MSDIKYIKNLGFVGSVCLLISSISGPGVAIIPQVFQSAGWFVSSISFIGIGILTGIASLFVVEASSRFPGNEQFERNVEFTILVHQFYGRRWYYALIFILYGSLTSTNIASIVGASQIFDNLFITAFGGTCGIGLSPISGLYCVTSAGNTNSPFGNNYMLITVGALINLMVIVPLTLMDINSNALLQLVSAGYLGIFTITVVAQSLVMRTNTAWLPAVGSDTQHILGTVIFNFALANEVPSWVNVTHPKVNLKKCVWTAISISCLLYIIIGIFGALSFRIDLSTNIAQAMYYNSTNLSPGAHGWIVFMYVLYPFFMYITSVPIAMIVVRLNFLASRITTKGMANFWAIYAPFLLAIPFQTGSLINHFGIWTSLTFQAICNFTVPFLIYAFLSKRNMVMAQSVIDELEFLDITAGIKKVIREDEDDFDYIYHLPHADLDRLPTRDPFKPLKEATLPPKSKSISQLSQSSLHSVRDLRNMLNPQNQTLAKRPSTRSNQNIRNIKKTADMAESGLSKSSLNLTSIVVTSGLGAPSTGPSINSTGISAKHSMKKNVSNAQLSTPQTSVVRGSDSQGSRLNTRGLLGIYGVPQRTSTIGSNAYKSGYSGQVAPVNDLDDFAVVMLNGGETYRAIPPFRALPKWITNIARPKWIAGLCVVLVTVLMIDVIVASIQNPSDMSGYTKNIPTLMFIGVGILTGFACLLVLEACSLFPGNEKFERNVEFTVLVHQ
eukprot:jgi/Hompol1/6900/HPOL_003765-RA